MCTFTCNNIILHIHIYMCVQELERDDLMEESQVTVERLMERYHELHSHKQEEVIVDELTVSLLSYGYIASNDCPKRI